LIDVSFIYLYMSREEIGLLSMLLYCLFFVVGYNMVVGARSQFTAILSYAHQRYSLLNRRLQEAVSTIHYDGKSRKLELYCVSHAATTSACLDLNALFNFRLCLIIAVNFLLATDIIHYNLLTWRKLSLYGNLTTALWVVATSYELYYTCSYCSETVNKVTYIFLAFYF
jgi:hypothetical protein